MDMTTDRLLIRRFVPEDWWDLYEYMSQETVCKYLPYTPFTEDDAKSEAESRARYHYWAICLKENNKLIGDVYLHTMKYGIWELGFAFNADYQKNGYAAESVKALIDDVFNNMGAHRVEATCDTQNTPSCKLLERLGFVREGHIRQNICYNEDEIGNPIWTDSYIYGLLRNEASVALR